jgi:carbon-monoxide dehydrogenase catalytic subunit
MEFIQRKTADRAVSHFLLKAADQEITLTWDRFESQLPECGFCESGLSCRDCFQGPCISHPFRDQSKLGVCGKDKDTLAVQTLMRLVLKGTMSCLDQLNDFADSVKTGEIESADKDRAEQTLKAIQNLLENGDSEVVKEFPTVLVDNWKTTGILPQGIARDIFKASQKLEGGICEMDETLLWTFKTSLLGCMADRLQRNLKTAVFGSTVVSELEVNLGVLQKDVPTILFYGYISPVIKQKIAAAAQEKNVSVMGVCTDPLLPPYRFSPVTTAASQEIPLMTGAVDLIVTGHQFVNPSLADVAKDWKVALAPADGLEEKGDLDAFARQIVEQAGNTFEIRQNIPKDVPMVKEAAVMGFSAADVDVKKIAAALESGKIKGIAILAGSNNVKYTQDETLATVAKEFLSNDILAVIDWSMTDFLISLSGATEKSLSDYPICAYFPEASRTVEVAKAMWTVAMGISTYFWPCLPVTGSPKTQAALTGFCKERFGASLHVITQKIDARTKAGYFLKTIKAPAILSGKAWE